MLRKIGLLLSVAACGALVTSCGDDDTSTPTPVATDTGTATPTATPSASTSFSLTSDFTASALNANYGFAFFTPDGGGTEVFNGGTRVNGTSAIEFIASPESATFIFPDLSEAVVFGETDFVSVTGTERRYAAGDMALNLFLPFSNVMRVNYEIDNQAFTSGTVDGVLRSQRVAVFFNSPTTTDDITTALTYTGAIDVAGGAPGETAADALSAPDMTFTVTPGDPDDTITGTITVFETVMGTQTEVASFDVDATVAASGLFQGVITDTANDLSGTYVGALAGPDREELIILFGLQDADVEGEEDDGDNRSFVGSFIGD